MAKRSPLPTCATGARHVLPSAPYREATMRRLSGARQAYEHHRDNIASMHDMIRGLGPDDHAERERLLWLLCGIHAGALTPVSEDEKRGMERVLAILDRKLGEGGGVGGNGIEQR